MGMIINPYAFATTAVASKWNSADKGPNITLGNSDFDCVSNGVASTWQGVRGVQGRSSGKLYFEIKAASTATGYTFSGFADASASILSGGGYIGGTPKSFGVRAAAGGSLGSGIGTVASSVGPDIGSSGYLQFAFDFDNSKVFLGLNNVWQNSGNPVAGTGAWITSLPAGTYYPACSQAGGKPETRTLITAGTFNGTIPAGYSPWG